MNIVLINLLVILGIMVVSYLLGSINFAIIYTKAFKGVDVRDFGSKNAGMTNVSRVAGKKAAALTFICDVAKGAVAVMIGRFLSVYLIDRFTYTTVENSIDPLFFAYLAGFCCIIGHIYPLFFGFRGGKGVASALGILLFVDWRVALLALLVFLIVLAFSRMVSLSSMCAAVSVPILTYLLYDGFAAYTYTFLGMSQHVLVTLCSLLYTIIIIFTHRSNIVRIVHGEEKKIGKKNKV